MVQKKHVDEMMAAQVAEMVALELDPVVMLVLVDRS
jgi:hypothetical protein